MNATELFHKDGKSTGVFYCQTCRRVSASQYLADQCCVPRKCDCGVGLEQYYTVCNVCREKQEREKEQKRFNEAQKINESDWSGWVQWDGYAFNDGGYAESVQDIRDYCDDECVAPPEYVWACKGEKFVNVQISEIIDRINDNAYEDFDPEDLVGVKELESAINAFNAGNSRHLAYTPDYTKAVILNKPNFAVTPT